MRMSQAFPSKWIKSSDLKNREVEVTIKDVRMEDVGGDGEEKPVMYFEGKQKGMVLNRTNSGRCELAFGTDETDEWHGKKVVLYSEPVQFQGRTVDGLRLRIPKPAPETTDSGHRHNDDEPPF